MILVYKTDCHHSYASRDIIAICSSKRIAMMLIKRKVKLEGEKLSEYDLRHLNNINQTQGYEGEGEFDMEEIDKNVLI